MTKFATLIILFLFASGSAYFGYINAQNFTNVVYAARDIPKGMKAVREDFVIKRIHIRQVAGDALCDVKKGVGRKVKYGISLGQQVNKRDFIKPPFDELYKSFKVVRKIDKNQPISEADIEERWTDGEFPGMITRRKNLIGRHANEILYPGQIMSENLLK